MQTNDPIFDPDGRLAKIITMPIPGRTPANAVLLYTDGQARVADLALCRPAAEPAEEPQPEATQ
jgi:hypothetical protein